MNGTMLASVATAWGGPDVLHTVDMPIPEPMPGEVLVRVEAAGINPTDWKSRATGGRRYWDDPVILGFDVAGVVEEVADGSHLLSLGDRVFGMPHFPLQAGAYAQYVAAPARHLSRMPDSIGFAEAASLPLAALTALQAVEEAGALRSGQSVLVCGAGGGVGRLAVQIAVTLGGVVTACARANRLEDAVASGAAIVESTADGLPSEPSLHDVVIDPFGGARTAELLRWCAPGATLVSLIPRTEPSTESEAERRGISLRRVVVDPSELGMKRIAHWLQEGSVRPRVARELPLTSAAEAHRLGERGGLDGKIVLRPWQRGEESSDGEEATA